MIKEIIFSSSINVNFGRGRIKELGEILVSKGFKRVLIITDKGIVKAGLIEDIKKSLGINAIDYKILDNVEENPSYESVKKVLEELNEYKPDLITAVGGGSVMDTSKAVAVWYTNQDKDLFEIMKSDNKKNIFPVVTIPTTAGTGSELTSWAVITDHRIKEKISIGGNGMEPVLAIVDPEMTVSLPSKLTLWTGMDAFIHALEAYVSRISNSFIQKQSFIAMEYIINNLPLVVKDGNKIEAREKMLLGSMIAGWAMQNVGLGLVHGMSHQVGAFYNTQHGLTNAILLPHILEYNYSDCSEELEKINTIFNNDKNLIENIRDLYNRLDLNQIIEIKNSDITRMAENALNNVNSMTNPRKPELEEIKMLYSQAFKVEGM
jgi:alcohol dehydrogenase